jgi:hypothetical protein
MSYIIWGIVVFGLTGLVTGLLGDAMLLGFAIMGAIAGGSLPGLTGKRTGIGLGILFGTVGFFIGFVSMFFLVLAIWEPPYLSLVFIGLFAGAISGLFMGFILKRKKAIGIMTLAGSLGFALGFALIEGLNQLTLLSTKLSPVVWSGLTMMLACIIGGIGIGVGVNFVMKREEP